jgi:putative transcriptional regulator
MSAPRHHPEEALLAAHVAGALSAIAAVPLATHLALCPDCRARANALEAIGGEVLEAARPAALGADALERTLRAIDEAPAARPTPPRPAGDPRLPEPLRALVGRALDDVPWRAIGRNFALAEIAAEAGAKLVLLKMAPGAALPAHRHDGHELTLVLAGGYADAAGAYRPGDLACADAATEHAPVADADGECLCLVMIQDQPRFTGWFGRLLQPFLRI